VKFWLGVLTAFLVISPIPETDIQYEVFVERIATVEEPVSTPVIDSFVDLHEFERQSDCLWTFLQKNEIEITLDNVITAGYWTDMHGGACSMIGEDDE